MMLLRLSIYLSIIVMLTTRAKKLYFLLPLLSKSIADYKYPFNINFEQQKPYLRKVAAAQKDLQEIADKNIVPRRLRRIYDRPKHDLDIKDYTAWRLYDQDQSFYKFHAHGAPVVAKIQLQPRWVIHAFGQGLEPMSHTKSTHKEFVFEDNNLARFLLYQYRNTTHYRPNVPNYDYENQENVRRVMRLTKRLEPAQFWESQDFFQFRLNASMYAQHLKFKKWIIERVEEQKTKPSYDQFIDKLHGPICFFNRPDQADTFKPFLPAVLNITPEDFLPLKKKEKRKPPTVKLPKKLDESHRVAEDHPDRNKASVQVAQ